MTPESLSTTPRDVLAEHYPAEVEPELSVRIAETVRMLREVSRQTEAQKLVEVFRHRSANVPEGDYLLSLSRRGLDPPWYRITRHKDWPDTFDPWFNQNRLPLLQGGLLGSLIYGDAPRILNDVSVAPDDPAHPYLNGARSILALPQYDSGVALNMVLRASPEPNFFDAQMVADTLVVSNLFGRAIHGLVLARQLEKSNAALDNEMRLVGRIQRSLLPESLPDIPGLDLAVSYETATRAGGDYYDLLKLPGGKLGILMADVSGHGTPAAVMMAILHTIVHTSIQPHDSPSQLLKYMNDHLVRRYTKHPGTFVTAFYGVYDPKTRRLTYSNAGHPAPRVKHCAGGTMSSLECARELVLGLLPDVTYEESVQQLAPGDQVIFYTDGIVEAQDSQEESFGMPRLDRLLEDCCQTAGELIDAVLRDVREFTHEQPPQDDRTMLVMKVAGSG